MIIIIKSVYFIFWKSLEECLEKEPRTYNSVQLAQKLEQELRLT